MLFLNDVAQLSGWWEEMQTPRKLLCYSWFNIFYDKAYFVINRFLLDPILLQQIYDSFKHDSCALLRGVNAPWGALQQISLQAEAISFRALWLSRRTCYGTALAGTLYIKRALPVRTLFVQIPAPQLYDLQASPLMLPVSFREGGFLLLTKHQ